MADRVRAAARSCCPAAWRKMCVSSAIGTRPRSRRARRTACRRRPARAGRRRRRARRASRADRAQQRDEQLEVGHRGLVDDQQVARSGRPRRPSGPGRGSSRARSGSSRRPAPVDSAIRRAARPVGATSSDRRALLRGGRADQPDRRRLAGARAAGDDRAAGARTRARTAAHCSGAGTRSVVRAGRRARRAGARGFARRRVGAAHDSLGQLAPRAPPSRRGRPRRRSLRRRPRRRARPPSAISLQQRRRRAAAPEQLAGRRAQLGHRAGRSSRRARPRRARAARAARARAGESAATPTARAIVSAIAKPTPNTLVSSYGRSRDDAVARGRRTRLCDPRRPASASPCGASSRCSPRVERSASQERDRLAGALRLQPARARTRARGSASIALEHVSPCAVEQPRGAPRPDVPDPLAGRRAAPPSPDGASGSALAHLDLQPVARVVLPRARRPRPARAPPGARAGRRARRRCPSAIAVDHGEAGVLVREAPPAHDHLCGERLAFGGKRARRGVAARERQASAGADDSAAASAGRWPSSREISCTCERTSSPSSPRSLRSSRAVGPETLTAATTSPSAPKIGAATQATPSSYSSRSSA